MAKKKPIKSQMVSPEEVDEAHEAPVLPVQEQAKPVINKHASLKVSLRNLYVKAKTFVLSRKKWQQIAMGVVVLVLLLLVVPFTRYPILGLFIKKDISIRIIDNQTGTPLSEAQVEVQGKTKQTDSDGVAKFESVKIGSIKVTVTKKYYDSLITSSFAGLVSVKSPDIKLVAQGRLINFKVTDKISKKPVQNISIIAGESKASSDNDGKALLVVPIDATEVEVKFAGDNYVETTQKYPVAEVQNKETAVEVVPSGSIYFLSKQSGKIDVVKTNLDGTNRQTVLAGTGLETDYDTILLASRDWKYLVLKAKRDTKKNYAAIYFISTADGKLSTIDEGNADFTLNGWSGKNLIFTVNRNEVESNKPDKYRLKSFNAETQKLTTLDRTSATDLGYGWTGYYYGQRYTYDYFGLVSVTDDKVFYIKQGSHNGACDQATNGIYLINPDGSGKQTVIETKISDKYISNAFTYKPGEVYYQAADNYCASPSQKYYEYEFGGKPAGLNETDYTRSQNGYEAFVVSPDGNSVFWADSRDGKNVFFVGDKEMENEKEVARLEEFTVYGWYTNDYLLVSKKGSELYIMPKEGGDPVKITDYHKPDYDYRGYGYGYGGL